VLLQCLQYTAAVKSSSLDPTAKALTSLAAIVEKDPKLSTILQAPTLSNEDKSAIVAELTKQAGSSSPTVKNFLDALAENNRLGLLKGVCEKFNEIMSAARGEVEMKVVSAQVRTHFAPPCSPYESRKALGGTVVRMVS
jgi:F-type H+-transporting ATPase subunit O